MLFLPGDGVGPEVTAEARKVLEVAGRRAGASFEFDTGLVGGAAVEATGVPLPPQTLRAARRADAVFLGAVGGPRWDGLPADRRPEAGLLALRRALGVHANLRPFRVHPGLAGASPLRSEVVAGGVDVLIVRELVGGLYFGRPRGRWPHPSGARAVDTMAYCTGEVRRVARVAFGLARRRRRRLASVDKANVLETSRLWREVVEEEAAAFPDVELEHVLVDTCAMRLVQRPRSFDVILTENTFGDILSDLAAGLVGSIGLLPSASLADAGAPAGGTRRSPGLYEPVHGSAPDIAGRGVANPVGAILSAALLLRHGCGLEAAARRVEGAVWTTLAGGAHPPDLGGGSGRPLGTAELGDRIARAVETGPGRGEGDEEALT